MIDERTPMPRTIKREDDPFQPTGEAPERQTKDQTGDDRDFVGLEDIGGHTGAIADIVTDEVCDHGGIAGIILRDASLDLANEVSANIRGFGEDATADAHEQRKQRTAKAEAQQCVRSCDAEEDEDQCAAEEAEAIGQHAGDGAGAVRNAQRVSE